MVGIIAVLRSMLLLRSGRGYRNVDAMNQQPERVRGSPVGSHLDRAWAVLERAGEKPASSRQIPGVPEVGHRR
jgi:hypothetical protein